MDWWRARGGRHRERGMNPSERDILLLYTHCGSLILGKCFIPLCVAAHSLHPRAITISLLKCWSYQTGVEFL